MFIRPLTIIFISSQSDRSQPTKCNNMTQRLAAIITKTNFEYKTVFRHYFDPVFSTPVVYFHVMIDTSSHLGPKRKSVSKTKQKNSNDRTPYS